MFKKKIPLFYLILVVVISPFLCFLYINLYIKKMNEETAETIYDTNKASFCAFNIQRLGGYQYIRPLLYAEPACESEELMGCKNQISQIINNNKNSGKINTASVYLRLFNQARWISINGQERFSPGSLLKVPELIAYYKMNEKTPGFLDKEITYDKNINTSGRILTYESKHIQLGKKYKIRDLLKYMIVFSDNDATMVLNSIIDKDIFSNVFTDVGLPAPDFSSSDYPMNSVSYSVFLKELYNASYLRTEDSEACLKLLSESGFSEGLRSGLPAGCVASHKFGEGGPNTEPNFSEAAIVYCGRTPYILTVMLKGNDMKVMPKVSKEISKKVYEMMSGQG